MPEPPPGLQLEPGQINVRFTPEGGTAEIIGKVSGEAACTRLGGGWYYDNQASPTKIHICDSTCAFFGGGLVEVVIGCTTLPLG